MRNSAAVRTVPVDPPQFEGGQQKQQAVDAGRDGEGQEVMAELAGEAEYHECGENWKIRSILDTFFVWR